MRTASPDLPLVEGDNTEITALQEPVETTQPAPSETTSEAIEEEIDTSYDSVVIISSPKDSSFQDSLEHCQLSQYGPIRYLTEMQALC